MFYGVIQGLNSLIPTNRQHDLGLRVEGLHIKGIGFRASAGDPVCTDALPAVNPLRLETPFSQLSTRATLNPKP